MLVLGSVGGLSAQIATDNFPSNSLSGGTGWSNSWSGGRVVDGALFQEGNSPQQLSRQISDLGLASVSAGEDAGFYSLSAFVSPDFSGNNGQNIGFRIFQSGQTFGTFSAVWKNDINNGQLTFYHGSERTGLAQLVVPGSEWQLSLANADRFDDYEYQFVFDVNVEGARNSGQFTGSYVAQVNATNGVDSKSFTTEELNWISFQNGVTGSQINQIQFQNTSPRTVLAWDDVNVSNRSQVVSTIPEPSSFVLMLAGLALSLRRRR